MSKARLHPTVLDLRGAMGDMLFRRRNGKLYASIKSLGTNKEPTEAQAAHRKHFGEAVAYGKRALRNEELLEIYKVLAAEKGTSAFNVAMTDFLKPPSISDLDPSEYRGQVGDKISFLTKDDVAVVSVQVTIIAMDGINGTPLENGAAVETAPGSNQWIYTTTAEVPAGQYVIIRATATDLPGGVGTGSINKYF